MAPGGWGRAELISVPTQPAGEGLVGRPSGQEGSSHALNQVWSKQTKSQSQVSGLPEGWLGLGPSRVCRRAGAGGHWAGKPGLRPHRYPGRPRSPKTNFSSRQTDSEALQGRAEERMRPPPRGSGCAPATESGDFSRAEDGGPRGAGEEDPEGQEGLGGFLLSGHDP